MIPKANLLPVLNLPLVSMTPWQFATGINDTGSKFVPGAIDTGGAPLAANISVNLNKKIGNGPNGILRGLGETGT
jgi:hypothetical protein